MITTYEAFKVYVIPEVSKQVDQLLRVVGKPIYMEYKGRLEGMLIAMEMVKDEAQAAADGTFLVEGMTEALFDRASDEFDAVAFYTQPKDQCYRVGLARGILAVEKVLRKMEGR